MKTLVLFLLLLAASAAYGEIFTWKDAKGTVHYTNSLHEIPARYLRKARVLDVATGKKGGPATASPAQRAPAAGGGSPALPAAMTSIPGVPSESPQGPAAAPVPVAPSSPAASAGNGVTISPPAAPAPAPRQLPIRDGQFKRRNYSRTNDE